MQALHGQLMLTQYATIRSGRSLEQPAAMSQRSAAIINTITAPLQRSVRAHIQLAQCYAHTLLPVQLP